MRLGGSMLLRLYFGEYTLPYLDLLFETIDAAVADADLVVAHPAASLWVSMACERRGVPWIVGDLFPMLLPSERTPRSGTREAARPWLASHVEPGDRRPDTKCRSRPEPGDLAVRFAGAASSAMPGDRSFGRSRNERLGAGRRCPFGDHAVPVRSAVACASPRTARHWHSCPRHRAPRGVDPSAARRPVDPGPGLHVARGNSRRERDPGHRRRH